MEKITLSWIAESCSGTLNGEDAEISVISTDTRKIEKGSLFVAVEGENFDGHDFCLDAEKAGAVAVLAHKKVDCNIPVIYVDDTRLAQLRFAGEYRRKYNIPVVGVTGSVGKTTKKEMIYAVLSSQYKTLKTEGNFNNDIGVPRMIFQLDSTYEAAVFEMGMSNSNEITYLSKATQPTVSVISNIGVSHIENLGSRENILKSKLEILDGMAENAPLIINGDDEYLSKVELEDRPVIFYSVNNKDCDFTAENIEQGEESTSFDILCEKGRYHTVIPTIGIHNVYNAVAAFAVGTFCGIEETKCAEALKNYVPSGMRQRIRKANDITFIEDCYNASPDSQQASVNALMGIKADRHIVVLGDMLELGSISEEAHKKIGKYVQEKNVDILCTYGEEAKNIAQGATDNAMKEVYSFTDKELLAEFLLKTLKSGDAVSFKASRGMRLEEVIKLIYKGMGIENE